MQGLFDRPYYVRVGKPGLTSWRSYWYENDLTIRLYESRSIHGTIRHDSGRPVSGAQIAGTSEGLFYGVQTMLQLLPPDVFSRTPVTRQREWTLPCVRIEDQPRFAWRKPA
ncbi:MAG: glycoside hydrolase family 20 zincin-like fold domain-containing protein [Planctomycetota bacterium]